MNAVLRPGPGLRSEPMTLAALDAVLAVERQAYTFPWTRGNFIDSLAAGYASELLLDAHGTLLGYWVAMAGVDELHLLNLTVAPAAQRRGHGRLLLDRLVARCRHEGLGSLWLEVRASNVRARALYARYGLREMGLRRAYYPAPAGQREDAVVMSLRIEASDGAQ